MTKQKVIILNGPPGSGKDVGASTVSGAFKHVSWKMMKTKLFKIVEAIIGHMVTMEEWDERYSCQKLKNEPWDILGGLSQREFLIKISEDWIKPVFGNTFFGEAAVADMEEDPRAEGFVFSDGGFIEEIIPMLDVFDVHYIKVYRDGCNFSNDSRSYLNLEEYQDQLTEYQLDNDGTLEQYSQKLIDLVNDIINNR